MHGEFEPLPERFGKHLANIVSLLLEKDPEKRPSINSLLKFKVMKKHVMKILRNDVYKKDFSNTLKHGLKVFQKVKEGKDGKNKDKKYDDNLILNEIIGDFVPNNGLP